MPICLPIRSVATGRGIADVLGRHRRWIAVVRGQRPALMPTYPLLLCAAPLIVLAGLLVGATAAGPGAVLAAAAALLAALARLLAGAAARRWSGRPPSLMATALDALLADLALLGSFLAACAARTVTWGERRLLLGPGGLLHER
jgi:ceramide glucosyltransferase